MTAHEAALPPEPERWGPGETMDWLRAALADTPTILAAFERHVAHDRDALGFALMADRIITPKKVDA